MRVLVMVLLASISAPTVAASATTLPAVLARVYEQSPLLAAARADLRALDEQSPIARAGRRPSIGLTSSTGMIVKGTGDTPDGAHAGRAGLFLEQPIYTGGRASSAIEQARRQVEHARAELDAREQDVLLSAVNAYLAVISADRRMALATANEQRSQRILANARDRYRLGGSTSTDVALAEAHLEETRADREALRAVQAAARADFAAIVGEEPENLEAAGRPGELPRDVGELRARVEDHPALHAAMLAVSVAESTIEIARSASASSMTFNGEASYVDQPGQTSGFEPQVRVGVSFEWPLYRGGGDFARERQARQAMVAREHDVNAVRRRLDAELLSARAAAESARLRRVSLEARRRAGRMAIDGLQQEAMLGLVGMTEVLDAEENLFETEVDLELVAHEEIFAEYRLIAATGGLLARRLGLDVVLYEPDDHFQEVQSKWFGKTVDDETGN
ncbi:MAG: TolC family protein [Geminicoccaceae bacterium]